MSKVKHDGWALKDKRGYIFATTFRYTKKDLMLEGYSRKEIKELGYKAVKVKITEVFG